MSIALIWPDSPFKGPLKRERKGFLGAPEGHSGSRTLCVGSFRLEDWMKQILENRQARAAG